MTPVMEHLNGGNGDENAVYLQRWFIVTIFSVLFILPLSLCKNISTLSCTSCLSIIAVIVVVIIICILAPTYSHHSSNHEPLTFIRHDFFQAIGTMSYAFISHDCAFIMYNSLSNANSSRWKSVSRMSVGTALVLSLILSVTGYMYLRDIVHDNILENFNDDKMAINVSRILYAMTMVFSFPISQFVARHCVMMLFDALCLPNSNQSEDEPHRAREEHQHLQQGGGGKHTGDGEDEEERNCGYYTRLYVVTLVLWGSSLCIGATVKDLDFVVALIGNTCASVELLYYD